ncbi:MAG: hypothetical protein KDE51_09985, partial [Anaerolineales bacterium]|nr:hypothetical protein [Anaerolineales bacterium]
MFHPILQTKLLKPRPRPLLVPRPHLWQKLKQGLSGKLTLVTAPAGYGKTTLVSTALEQMGHFGAWIALDERDNDPQRFLAYLAAAVQGAGILWQPESAELPSLINQLTTYASPVRLVLDDYHLITTTAVHEWVAFLIDHAPPNFHLILTSRVEPPLPLARWRARGQLQEIGFQELLFAETETAVLLNQLHALDLSAADLQTLTERTEGWITALQLSALSLRQRAPAERRPFIQNFAGNDRHLFDYLLTEVMAQQPAARQTFLQYTAFLTELNAASCAAVLEHPPTEMQQMLQAIEQENLFLIPLDNRREWYRYHHLFADFLRQQLTQRDPSAIPLLHQRASRWYAAHGRLDAAVSHSLLAEDWPQVAELLQTEDLLRHLSPHKILSSLAQLPPSVLDQHPRLATMQLWVLLESGQLDEAESRLQWLEKTASAEVKQECLVIRIHLARHRQAYEQAITLSEELLQQLSSVSATRSLSQRLGTVFGLAEVYYQMANWAAAEARFAEAAALSQQAGSVAFNLRARLGAVQVWLAQGRGELAVSVLADILAAAEPDFSTEAAVAQQLLTEAMASLA